MTALIWFLLMCSLRWTIRTHFYRYFATEYLVWSKKDMVKSLSASAGTVVFNNSSNTICLCYLDQTDRVWLLECSTVFNRLWSNEAVDHGAESLGYSGMAHGMFPEGGVALVNHFYSSCNDDLQQILKDKVKDVEENPENKRGTTAFIRDAVEIRLRMNLEYLDSWAYALALHANPTNAPNALRNVGTMLDHMWYYAGDRSTDFNWYTKRGLLGMVYKSSELCLLQDKSEDFKETWEFLDRRLSEIHNAANIFRNADHLAKDVKTLTEAGVITALNIFGMNSRSR
ncbi:unnamed protein product, partial [Meganyctiphanes norvegica]